MVAVLPEYIFRAITESSYAVWGVDTLANRGLEGQHSDLHATSACAHDLVHSVVGQ
jgi:hypothetical protein